MDDLSDLIKDKLLSFLIPELMSDGHSKFGQYGLVYMKQVCRLIDKAVIEFERAWEDFLKDGREASALYMFSIMNHLENSINATHRAFAFFDKVKGDRNCPSLPRDRAKLAAICSGEIKKFRDSIEHFDERIQKSSGPALLIIDKNGKRACLGESELAISLLSRSIRDLHSLIKHLILEKKTKCLTE